MEDQYVVHSHHQAEFYTHPPQFTANTKQEQGGHQMLEVCSPIVSSTSHPELKIAMNPSLGQVRAGTFQAGSRQQENNIGSIITMLIDEQGADIDEILIENRDRANECRERLEETEVVGTDIKEENCLSDQLVGMEYPRSYPSPDYAYYQRDYVAQEGPDKDLETRSSLSSNSEGDESDMTRYSTVAGGYNPVMTQSISPPGMVGSPYMMTREDPSDLQMTGMKKDDKKNNLAAKKSRDARRVRENQLRLRVLCLENANRVLREQMERKDVELAQLRERLNKYEGPLTNCSEPNSAVPRTSM